MSGVSALIQVLDFARVKVDQKGFLPIPKSVGLICLKLGVLPVNQCFLTGVALEQHHLTGSDCFEWCHHDSIPSLTTFLCRCLP